MCVCVCWLVSPCRYAAGVRRGPGRYAAAGHRTGPAATRPLHRAATRPYLGRPRDLGQVLQIGRPTFSATSSRFWSFGTLAVRGGSSRFLSTYAAEMQEYRLLIRKNRRTYTLVSISSAQTSRRAHGPTRAQCSRTRDRTLKIVPECGAAHHAAPTIAQSAHASSPLASPVTA